MVAAELMGGVYWQLLKKLEANQFNVFGAQPIRVTKSQKLFLILRSWICYAAGLRKPNYGTP